MTDPALAPAIALAATNGRAPRLAAVDVARGVAILAMVAYHFTWDLSFLGLIRHDIGADPWWQALARLIAGSFLLLVGVSLILSLRHGFRPRPYVRRLAQIAGAAAVITVATYFAFPERFIYFGILHCIALSSVLGLPLVRLPASLLLIAAAGAIAAPTLFADPMFDHPAWRWLGLMSYFPPTNDYVPLLPWFGPVLIGMAVAKLALERAPGALRPDWTPTGPISRALRWAGRHGLALYLLHQPLLLGTLSLIAGVLPVADQAANFDEACRAGCVAEGATAAACTIYCACVADGLATAGLWDEALAGALGPDRQPALQTITRRCGSE